MTNLFATIDQKSLFSFGTLLFGTAMIIYGITGLLLSQTSQTDNRLVAAELTGLDQFFTIFVYVKSCLFICSGGMIVAERQMGPVLAFIMIIANGLISANPFPRRDGFDKASTWTLLVKTIACLGGAMLLVTRGKIMVSR
jgi:hypothetical protein